MNTLTDPTTQAGESAPHDARPSAEAIGATRARRGGGFTVVELMIAVLIVGVLAAIALPMFRGWQEKIKIKTAVDEIAAISVVIEGYLQDTGSLPASLSDVKRGSMVDPWGKAYQYTNLSTVEGNGKARKDHSLVPLNTDFDLYSSGPDGASVGPLTATASRDDILRARNGRFIGEAKDF